MYACPGCGGGLKFDIESQQLKCDYCSNVYDPYSIVKEEDAALTDRFGASVFVCPNCGAEIISSDDTAAAFCGYCGESTILSGNMRKEKRPEKIIPFKLTKAACKDIYARSVRRSLFAPKSFLDPSFLDKMTGIYMPYWLYNVKMKDTMTVNSTRDHRSGDYILHEHYKFTANNDLTYEGIQYDAASNFADTISDAIAPFHMKEAVDFTPSYLSGFFADVQDVGSGTYTEKAGDLASTETYDRMKALIKSSDYEKYGDLSETGLRANVASTKSSLALLPVWFLTWRRGDRVSYAVINGETGQMSLDLPVDIKKYLLFTAVLTVPIFFLLEAILSMRASSGLLAVIVIALLSLAIYYSCTKEIRTQETHENDLGYKARQAALRRAAAEAAYEEEKAKDPEKAKKRSRYAGPLPNQKKKKKKGGKRETVLLVSVIIVIAIFTALIVEGYSNANKLTIPAAIGSVFALMVVLFDDEGSFLKRLKDVLFLPLITFIGCMVAFLDLHSDLWYYGLSILTLVMTCLLFISLIRKYNLLATRPMPYFKRTGGDDRA